MGTFLAILKGVAQAIGLADRLEAWLERRRANQAGRQEQIADDQVQDLKGAEGALKAAADTTSHSVDDQLRGGTA